jgi:hypothetical protein
MQSPEKDVSPNQTFYENLPFRGLKRPPTQVLALHWQIITYIIHPQVISRDSCDYADCEYADYADGPIGYNATSKLQAVSRKTENEEKQP